MAVNKPSRPTREPINMLSGLNNLTTRKNSNLIETNTNSEIIEPTVNVEPTTNVEPLKNVDLVEKRKPGRPRKFKKDANTEVIGVRLLSEEVRFLEEYGGKYGGKTGYVTHLIRQEMERIKKYNL